MKDETPARASLDAGRYEIRFTGHLDSRWADWFDGLNVSHEPGGVTVLSGLISDQAALYGILERVRDLGLPLLSVERIGTDAPEPDELLATGSR